MFTSGLRCLENDDLAQATQGRPDSMLEYISPNDFVDHVTLPKRQCVARHTPSAVALARASCQHTDQHVSS